MHRRITLGTATDFFKNRYSLTGLDNNLNEEERAFQDMIHRFSADVVRPIGIELDRLTPEQVIAADSPLWTIYAKLNELGLNEMLMSGELTAEKEDRFTQILLEELAWGDAGIAVSVGAGMTPSLLLKQFPNEFVQQQLPAEYIGSWCISEPDHGSDQISGEHVTKKPNCLVKVDGDEVVISGQKAAWVSNGPIATHTALFATHDDGNGNIGQCIVIVPLDLDGITRGKPLDKMGQRALPQGEVYFDNVRLSKEWIIVQPENYALGFEVMLSFANAGMGTMFTGLARAAFEQALDYAHERVQGGVVIIEHQDVQRRLFNMFTKIEMSRALSQRVNAYNVRQDIEKGQRKALLGAAASKTAVTDMCMEVTSDALQMFGGNGLTKEYQMEKMFRDARAAQIEDGCNHILRIKGGSLLNMNNPLA